ncbi:hypothetical protein [Aphanothece sacrum]|uniref:Cupin n=1 Tax=Aphanothece sacrum FPU1 TaxID=1920663 RepID=A0A401IJW8_APHSA|nr:hypothetical protein [Aphanothece sacrum]GBF81514.1 cupin [Aphanothece sacrum FPU1]
MGGCQSSILGEPDPDPYETILIIHQKICFGNQNPTLSLLETCQQDYQKIDI